MVVVVTDTSTIEQDREEVRALEALPGVLTAHVVYANVEDLHLPPSSPPGGHDSAGELSP